MGGTRVGPQAIGEYLVRMGERYGRARRTEKGRLLDEVCEVTGYHRKAVIRLLRRPASRRCERRRGRPTRYGPEVVAAVQAIWTAAGYPWSVRLKALIPLWLPWARGRLRLTPPVEEQFRRISARQIDRRLQPQKRQLATRLYGRTKPGTLLKHHIPRQTERWSVTTPGFTEIDLVSHSGDCADGEFIHSLNVTDIPPTWVETHAVMGKGQERVRQALEIVGSVRTAVLFVLVMELTRKPGAPIRRCPECDGLFYRNRKQKYCRRKCVNAANMRAWLKTKKRQAYLRRKYAAQGWHQGGRAGTHRSP